MSDSQALALNPQILDQRHVNKLYNDFETTILRWSSEFHRIPSKTNSVNRKKILEPFVTAMNKAKAEITALGLNPDERPVFMGIGMHGGPNDPPIPHSPMDLSMSGAFAQISRSQDEQASPAGPVIDPSLSEAATVDARFQEDVQQPFHERENSAPAIGVDTSDNKSLSGGVGTQDLEELNGEDENTSVVPINHPGPLPQAKVSSELSELISDIPLVSDDETTAPLESRETSLDADTNYDATTINSAAFDSEGSDDTFKTQPSPPSTDYDPNLDGVSTRELDDLIEEGTHAELKVEKLHLTRRLQNKKILVNERQADFSAAYDDMLKAQDIFDDGSKRAKAATGRVNQRLVEERECRVKVEKAVEEESRLFERYETAQALVEDAPINSEELDRAVVKAEKLGKRLAEAEAVVQAARTAYDLKKVAADLNHAVAAKDAAASCLKAAKNTADSVASELKKVTRELEGPLQPQRRSVPAKRHRSVGSEEVQAVISIEDSESEDVLDVPPARKKIKREAGPSTTAASTMASGSTTVFNSSKRKKFAEEKSFHSDILLGGLDAVKNVLRNKCYKHCEVRSIAAVDQEHGTAKPPVPSDAPFPGGRSYDEVHAEWKDKHLDCGCTKVSHILDLLAFKDPAQGPNSLSSSAAFRYGNVNQREAYLRLLSDVTHCSLDMMLAPELQRTFQVVLESLFWVGARVKSGVEVDRFAGEDSDLGDAIGKTINDVYAIYKRLSNIKLSEDD